MEDLKSLAPKVPKKDYGIIVKDKRSERELPISEEFPINKLNDGISNLNISKAIYIDSLQLPLECLLDVKLFYETGVFDQVIICKVATHPGATHHARGYLDGSACLAEICKQIVLGLERGCPLFFFGFQNTHQRVIPAQRPGFHG